MFLESQTSIHLKFSQGTYSTSEAFPGRSASLSSQWANVLPGCQLFLGGFQAWSLLSRAASLQESLGFSGPSARSANV